MKTTTQTVGQANATPSYPGHHFEWLVAAIKMKAPSTPEGREQLFKVQKKRIDSIVFNSDAYRMPEVLVPDLLPDDLFKYVADRHFVCQTGRRLHLATYVTWRSNDYPEGDVMRCLRKFAKLGMDPNKATSDESETSIGKAPLLHGAIFSPKVRPSVLLTCLEIGCDPFRKTSTGLNAMDVLKLVGRDELTDTFKAYLARQAADKAMKEIERGLGRIRMRA